MSLFKQIIYVLSVFICTVWFSVADFIINPYRFAAAGGGCTVTHESYTAGGETGIVGSNGTNDWMATQFLSTSAYTLCAADLYLTEVGTASGDLKVYIYSDDGANKPNAQVGTASDVIAASTLTGTEAAYKFTGMNVSIADATLYWLVVNLNPTGDVSNHVLWGWGTTATTEEIYKDDDGAGTWSLASATRSAKYVLYSN